ncbi:MAG: hypothetical protein K8S00_12190 [Bacteroidales bacterium]|nr:hypothetical protein [Bacteroidales bacterium]
MKNNIVVKRFISKTPPFWKKVRNWSFFGGLVFAGLVQGFATAGISIPAITIILTVAGGVCSVVGGGLSQLATEDEKIQTKEALLNYIKHDTTLSRKEKRIQKRKLKRDNRIIN